MVVDRHEDYWTRNEKRERETGTSVVAGGVFVVIIALIATAFAIFGPIGGQHEAASPPPAAADGTQATR
ncbi:MAG: hypothetical protein AB7F76_00190 [Parvibaculaceae bacterium]